MLKCVCDICEKELAVSETGVFPLGPQLPGWAIVSLSGPQKRLDPCLPYEPPVQLLVCSLECSEKALVKAGEYLRKAFAQAGCTGE